MYAVRRWDEEVVKWMAVGIVLAMVGLMAMPLGVGDVGYYIGKKLSGEYGGAFGGSAGAAAGPLGAIIGAGIGGL